MCLLNPDLTVHQVNNTLFKSHRHLLSKFSVLSRLIENVENGYKPNVLPHILPPVFVQRDESGVDDFRNMFKVLYAS
jgi:hypothetical protein